MEGFDDETYGEAFADVYDDWYGTISDVDATVATLLDLAGAGPVLELGVGTGRLAIPLATAGASRGVSVVGIDASERMLTRLREQDPDDLVTAVRGSMVDDLPSGPFAMAFAAYNTLFNLRSADLQQACFAAVAARVAPEGRFVIEAFVPDDGSAGDGRTVDDRRIVDDVSVRSLTADRVVLSVSIRRPDRHIAEGQFVELTEAGGVRLRPWSIRYAAPAELDAMAAAVGFVPEHRWESFAQEPFDTDSERHVTVYRRATKSRATAVLRGQRPPRS